MTLQITPLRQMYSRQNQWFAARRNELLRKANISKANWVLDLGCGCGEVTTALNDRCAGHCVGVDIDAQILRNVPITSVQGDAVELPFSSRLFNIVFAQMFFLWAKPLRAVINEIRRVLAQDGTLIISAEPDYGGAICYPDSIGVSTLIDNLQSEGANPFVGRELGSALQDAGFTVSCGVHPVRPLEAGQPDSPFAAPELLNTPGCEFLFIPYFYYFARL